MNKSIILSFVFALIASGAFAQNISRPAETEKPKQEKQADKSMPTDARPGTQAPTTRPSGQTEVEKGKPGKKGQKGNKGKNGKRKGHSKDHKGKGKAKGHDESHHSDDAEKGHEGHNHGKGEGHGRRPENETGKSEKSNKPPVTPPASGRKTQKN